MMRRVGTGLGWWLALLVLGGCAHLMPSAAHAPKTAAVQQTAGSGEQSERGAKKGVSPVVAPKMDLRARLLLPEDTTMGGRAASDDARLYSFKANELPITQALTMFARSYNLNMIVDPYAITGSVTVEFHDVPFDQAMEAILHTAGYHWYREGRLIFVEAMETRQFVLDFLATPGNDRIWERKDALGGEDKLEDQLKSLLSDAGKMVMNRLTGTIQVTDLHPNVEAVAEFLNQLRRTIRRQVEIEIKIVEVTLNDDTSLGIDWNRINLGSLNFKFSFSTANTISAPAGGFALISPTIKANGGYTSRQGKGDINAVISALSEQGNVRIISQPHIRTLNNQPALVKVGTDRTFITQETTTTSSTTTSTSVGYTKEVVPEGLELMVTPQISASGWVMLDVKPKITRVSSVTEVKDASGNVVSSGPNLDVRETQSLVRVHDGQTAVIGGLIQTVKSDTNRKVPLFGDIPLLGGLFRGAYKKDRRTELVIFLTPHLIGTASATSDVGGNIPRAFSIVGK